MRDTYPLMPAIYGYFKHDSPYETMGWHGAPKFKTLLGKTTQNKWKGLKIEHPKIGHSQSRFPRFITHFPRETDHKCHLLRYPPCFRTRPNICPWLVHIRMLSGLNPGRWRLFYSHVEIVLGVWGYPNSWMVFFWKRSYRNGWWLGVPPNFRKPQRVTVQESDAVKDLCTQRWRQGGSWLWQECDELSESWTELETNGKSHAQ